MALFDFGVVVNKGVISVVNKTQAGLRSTLDFDKIPAKTRFWRNPAIQALMD
jgi:hypothetical protein